MSRSSAVAFNTTRKLSNQNGFAALLLLVVLTMGCALRAPCRPERRHCRTAAQREDRTAAALRQAKEALIAYAITYSDTHPDQVIGYLPCPDDGSQPEGVSALVCGTARVSQLGRLPWRTLGLGPLHDSDGQCLWYAVSGTYKNNPKSGLMNWDSSGQFEVFGPDGVTLLAGSASCEPRRRRDRRSRRTTWSAKSHAHPRYCLRQ